MSVFSSMSKKNNIIRYILPLIITVVYWIYGTFIISVIMKIKNYQIENIELTYAVVNIIISVTVIGILFLLKGKFGKFSIKSYFAGIGIYGLPSVLFSIFYFTESMVWIWGKGRWFYPPNLNEIFWFNMIYYISVAVAEELVFRTAVVNCLFRKRTYSKAGIIIGCIYSGILFGGVHIMNFFNDPQMEMKLKIYTIVYGCLIGFVYTVIYLKTKNIFATMTLHFLWDITAEWNSMMIHQKFRNGGEYSFLSRQIPIMIFMTIIAGIILWRSKSKDLLLWSKTETENEHE